MDWKIEKRKISELKGYEKNPRKFTKKGLKDLKESLERCGDANIITINKDNTILGGHARFHVMKELGYKEVDVKVPDRLLTEEEIKEIVIRLNANTAGEWDLDKLTLNFDKDILSNWGLDINFPRLSNEIKEDKIPKKIETRTKPKQLWKLGNHYLYCGDATSAKDILTLMQNKKADLYLTDPPYNVNYEGGTKDKLTIKNDNMTAAQFITFLTDSFSNARKVLKEGAAYYIFHADNYGTEFRTIATEQLGKIRQCLIWNKNRFTLSRQDYQWQHEPCLYGWVEGAAHYFINEFNHSTVLNQDFDLDQLSKTELRNMLEEILQHIKTSVIDCQNPVKSKEHPTMKPIKLLADLIENSTKSNAIVLDTFGGSGSTLIACEQLNRSCYTMELDTKYCDVILQRWENFTNQSAELVEYAIM